MKPEEKISQAVKGNLEGIEPRNHITNTEVDLLHIWGKQYWFNRLLVRLNQLCRGLRPQHEIEDTS